MLLHDSDGGSVQVDVRVVEGRRRGGVPAVANHCQLVHQIEPLAHIDEPSATLVECGEPKLRLHRADGAHAALASRARASRALASRLGGTLERGGKLR